MGSMEMARWQVFFDKSGEDLWTVIDWALTIAAVNFPQELRIRRDGFAEKLFGPPMYPPVSSNCDGPAPSASTEVARDGGGDAVVGGAPHHRPPDHRRDEHFVEHAATCSYGDEEGLTEERDEETLVVREIISVRRRLEDFRDSSPEDEFLGPLQRLEQMNISVKALKVTEIGKVVNGLRKHGSRRVAAAAKRLVKLWKDVVDEWAETAGKEETAEIAARAGSEASPNVLPDVKPEVDRRTTKPVCSDASQMLDIVDDDARPAYRPPPHPQSRDCVRDHSQPRTSSTNLPPPSWQPEVRPEVVRSDVRPEVRTETRRRIVPVGQVKKTCPPPPQPHIGPTPPTPESEKLAAARKRMSDGYRQAANAKKQRTVQVVGLEQVPQLNGGMNGTTTRKR